jgi:hypothetical protein
METLTALLQTSQIFVAIPFWKEAMKCSTHAPLEWSVAISRPTDINRIFMTLKFLPPPPPPTHTHTHSHQDYIMRHKSNWLCTVKVKLSLFLTKHHATKYWGSGGIVPRINLCTRGRWVVSFTPRPLYPRERDPGTHWIGGWVGPTAVLDAVVKGKIPSPRRESNPRTPIVQPVAQRCKSVITNYK